MTKASRLIGPVEAVYARGSVLRLAPPFCITSDEVVQLVGLVADSIDELEGDLSGSRVAVDIAVRGSSGRPDGS